jgi:hypothetical protein
MDLRNERNKETWEAQEIVSYFPRWSHDKPGECHG